LGNAFLESVKEVILPGSEKGERMFRFLQGREIRIRLGNVPEKSSKKLNEKFELKEIEVNIRF